MRAPMSHHSVHVRLDSMQYGTLDAVTQIEQSVYDHPWSRRNFEDVLQSGYQAQMLMAEDRVLGYFVAMKGVEEVHLLNMTVAPAYQRQGWGRLMLDALDIWGRGQGAQWAWLEVRCGNARAKAVYEAHGYQGAGVRKGYYPGVDGQREDALVMCHALHDGGPAC